MEEPTRIIIADDHPIFREGLVRAIERDKMFADNAIKHYRLGI